MIGLLLSKALISIASGGLFVNFIFSGNLKQSFSNFFQQKRLFVLSLFFFSAIIALSYSVEVPNGLRFVVNKTYFLIIPLAISRIKKFDLKQLNFLLSFFVLIIFISGIVIITNYISAMDYYNDILKRGGNIWTPGSHIRYSLMVVFAMVTSFHLSKSHQSIFDYFHLISKKTENRLWTIIGVFLFVLIHILAVRSGIVVLYIVLLFFVVESIFTKKKYSLGVFLFLLTLLLPIISYQVFDSFKNRINYMKYDIEQFRKNEIGDNSDSRRLVSDIVGWKIAKEYFPWGCGTGAMDKTAKTYYAKHYPKIKKENQLLPHNQFLWTLAEYGIVGLISLFIGLFYPVMTINWFKNSLFISFWIIMFVSLLVEATFEVQLGISFFSLFYALLLKRTK